MNLDKPVSDCKEFYCFVLMSILVITYRSQSPTSTFIQRHIDDIGGGDDNFMQLHEWSVPMLGGRALWNTGLVGRVLRRLRVMAGAKVEDLHCAAFTRALRRMRPDAVLAEFGYSGAHIMEACQRLEIPLVVHFHGTDINRLDLFEKHKAGYQRLGKLAGALITVSELEKSKLTEIGIPGDKVHVIPCGAVLPDELSSRERSSGEGCEIVSTTRMSEVKAPHLVIVAFRKYLDRGGKGTLHMVGDGPLLPFCESLARGLGVEDRCVFHGSVPHDEVKRLLARADIYVQHSVVARDGDCEGMPVSLMEAAGYGLPIVTTGVGGIPEYFEDGSTARIIEEYDTDTMADRMHEIWRSPSEADSLGEAACRLAHERFDSRRQSQAVKDVVIDVISRA